ncbi:purine-cytosine permease family protein [Micrococcoides hystricis]|uniref:Purine-cytosine permease family protein n=1 Tax=Micrococcoides hystricis TaxID=1572761 RepID=A0ABV6PE17_9MICC
MSSLETKKVGSIDSSLAAAAEDHSLVSVPQEDRKSGFVLAISPLSVATALVIFGLTGFSVFLAGFKVGLLAGVIVGTVGFLVSRGVGMLAFKTGMSSTLNSRFFGLGFKGSSIASAIVAFLILGFLAVESALLYEGTILMMNLEDTWPTRIIIYGLMTAAWILLAIFGLKFTIRTSGIMIVATLLIALYLLYQIYFVQGASVQDVVNFEGVVPGGTWPRLEAALGVVGALGGSIALNSSDFARYCRTKKDVTILAVAGPIMMNVIMTVLGSLIVIGGMPAVGEYLMARNSGLSPQEASEMASGYIMDNTGAFFVIFAGWLGFLTIYAAQAKAQAINAYIGSLSLVNLLEVLFRWKPGRAWMVVAGNGIALLMIILGIAGNFSQYLAYLGCLTFSLAGIMIADYYIVRKRQFDGVHETVENWNMAGIATLVIAAAIGATLMVTGIVPLGFYISLVLSLILYPVLRKAMPKGTGTSFAGAEDVAHEAV